MAKKHSSSRLLVKIASGINTLGEKAFEEHIDNILTTKTIYSLGEKKRADYIKAGSIINIVSNKLDIPKEKVKDGTGSEEEKFALSISVYFIKMKMRWPHAKISDFFERKSHSFVNVAINYINGIDATKKYNQEKVEAIKTLEERIDTAFNTK